MNQLPRVQLSLRYPGWMAATSVLICLFLAACQPIRPGATLDNPAQTIPAAELAIRQTERWSATAPDGEWTAAGLVALPKPGKDQYYTELRVRRVNGNVEWTPVATWSNFGLGYTTPRPLHWSPDGRYLYFTNAPVVDGCGIFVNGSDLQRLDLSDGTINQLLPPDTTSSLAFAPDGQTVAYNEGALLYLLDPMTSDYATLTLDILQSNVQWGNFVWAPDSQQLVFTVIHEPCGTNQQHSIVWADRSSMTIRLLLEQDARLLTAVAWFDPEHIQLEDQDGQPWELDINTGEITQ